MMPRDTLIGSRIRERRITLGMKQADLAQRADISASYLNLIEHNRRRIGGKLLLDIATILGVELSTLTKGAEATLIAALREAASEVPEIGAELDRVDEFAGRFPGWAALLSEHRRRIEDLERTVVTLTDRLTHDPHLAASVHEMLSTVTAIRSAAAILAEPGEIEPEWQDRFHRNINEDSARLAETSQSLVRYLDNAGDAATELRSPQEEVDAVLARNSYFFEDIDAGTQTPEQVLAAQDSDLSSVAGKMLLFILRQLQTDAVSVPQSRVIEDLRKHGVAPFKLAQIWSVDPCQAMRRIAALAPKAGFAPLGLAVCDASGTLIYRQPIDSFSLPRFGGACPMLPLYQALGRPMLPVVAPVQPSTRDAENLQAFAFAQPVGVWEHNRSPLLQAHMLISSEAPQSTEGSPVLVGVTCRICPREKCPGRREPSILSGGM